MVAAGFAIKGGINWLKDKWDEKKFAKLLSKFNSPTQIKKIYDTLEKKNPSTLAKIVRKPSSWSNTGELSTFLGNSSKRLIVSIGKLLATHHKNEGGKLGKNYKQTMKLNGWG